MCFALRPATKRGVLYTNFDSLLSIFMTFRLRQLQVIHRHGDRTPLVNLLRGSNDIRMEKEEEQLWDRHLPKPTQRAQLGARFSVQSSTDASSSFQQRPFGYLTTRGIEQMRMRGQWLVRCNLQSSKGAMHVVLIRSCKLNRLGVGYTVTETSLRGRGATTRCSDNRAAAGVQ